MSSFYTRKMCEAINLTWITGPANASNIRPWEVRKIGSRKMVPHRDSDGVQTMKMEFVEDTHLRRYLVVKRPKDMKCICGQHPLKPNGHQSNATSSSLLPESDPYVFKVPIGRALKKRPIADHSGAKRARMEKKEAHTLQDSALSSGNVEEDSEDCLLITDEDLYDEFQ